MPQYPRAEICLHPFVNNDTEGCDVDKPRRLLDTREAAEIIGVQPQTLAGWRSKGIGPRFIKLPGVNGFVRYRLEHIDEYLDSQSMTCAPAWPEQAADAANARRALAEQRRAKKANADAERA